MTILQKLFGLIGQHERPTPPPLPRQPTQPKRSRKRCERLGREFEVYVITRFDNREYRLLDWRSDKFIKGWGGPESSKAPDISMEVIASRDRFAIECKYRSAYFNHKWFGDGVEWAKGKEQIQRYRDFEKDAGIPVYIAIGVNGSAEQPQDLFIVRLARIEYPFLKKAWLESFRFPSDMAGLEFG